MAEKKSNTNVNAFEEAIRLIDEMTEAVKKAAETVKNQKHKQLPVVTNVFSNKIDQSIN